jgi:hypothetical protein
MTTNEELHAARRRTRNAALIYGLCAAMLSFGAGLEVKAYVDQDLARQARAAWAASLDLERNHSAAREAHLNAIIEDERDHHAAALRQRDAHMAAFTSRNVGMRNDLEAMLADSRRSGDACIARAAGIADAVGALLDTVGEGAGLLEEAQRENQRLTEANRKLAGQVAGWQQRYAERTQRITVTAKKPAG